MDAISPDGVRIYYETTGQGPPLVLHHGFSDSLHRWYESGMAAALADEYTLVLIDGRGHGASDKPVDPDAYAIGLRVADVLAVLDDLELEWAHYLGYSMGGWIGLGLGSAAPHRIRSLAVGGAQPYGQNLAFFRQALRNGIEDWVAMAERTAGPRLTAADRQRLRANDLRALRACVAVDRPDISDRLSALTMPCLLFAGSADGVRDKMERCARELPNATFYLVPRFNHFELAFHIDVMVPVVRQFLKTGRLDKQDRSGIGGEPD